MDVKLLGTFAEHQDLAREIVLSLDSCGGYVPDMRDAVKVIDLIKMTHKVHTRVGPGRMCGSACVFVFLTGKRRYAARLRISRSANFLEQRGLVLFVRDSTVAVIMPKGRHALSGEPSPKPAKSRRSVSSARA